jgi:hypothetical protein
MSLLPNDTFANSVRPLYAALGSGGGGGGGSSLQSPASITPAAITGAVSLALVNAAGGGTAFLSVQDTTGNTSTVEITNADGGNSAILMGTSGGSQILIVAPSLADEGKLEIQAEGTAISYLTVDVSNNNVVVGDIATAGSVNLNCATVIKDVAGGANGLGLSPVSATTCLVCPTLATSGNLSLGSSVSNTQVLQLVDVAGDATVYVSSATGQNNLALRSNNTGSSIIPGAASLGSLTLGSSSTNPSGITLTDAATNLTKLGGAPQQLLASQNLAPGNVSQTTFVFPAPVGEGLYSIVGCSNGVTTANSRQAQASCICYVDSAGLIQMGGSAFADVGSVGSADALEWAPTNNTSFTGAYTGAQQVNNFSIFAFKLSGAIPGVVA